MSQLADPLIARSSGVCRLAGIVVVLSVMVACDDGIPVKPQPPQQTAFVVSSVTPNTATSGTLVSIAGSGFRPGLSVTFGGVKAESASFVDSRAIVARTPQVAPGPVDVVVTNTDGERATLAGAFAIIPPAPFAVSDYFPRRGYGHMLFGIMGPGLTGANVTFGGVEPPFVTFHPSGIIVGLLPHHAPGTVEIKVTHTDGRIVTIPNGLTYVPAPVLTASPATITAGGSVTVTWVAEMVSSIDYISLYPVGGQAWDEIATQHVTDKSGSMTFTFPSSVPPGTYEFRFLPTEGQWGGVSARSNVVTLVVGSTAK